MFDDDESNRYLERMRKLSAGEKKSKPIFVRVTKDEHQAILRLVAKQKTTASEWLRDLAKKALAELDSASAIG